MTDPSSEPLPSEPSPMPDLPLSASMPAAAPAAPGTPPRLSLPASPASRLKPLRVRGRVLAWAIAGVILAGAGLLLITGLAGTPWLFLLYPLLIGLLLVSLSAIALHLLHKL